MPTLWPTVLVEVELSGAGGGWTDLRADGDVSMHDGLTIRTGMTDGGPTSRVAATGTAQFSLKNDTTNSGGLLGYYSRHHANRRSGWTLGIACRIRMTDPDTSTTWTRFLGRIDAIDPVPGKYGSRLVRVTAVDWIDEAARWQLTADIGEQVNKRSDQVIAAIIAEMPAAPATTDYDVGPDIFPVALDSSAQSATALAEFQKLAQSDLSFLYMTRSGALRLESRGTRLLNTTSTWTIPDTALHDLTLPSSRDDIINTVRATTHPKRIDDVATTIVYDQANQIALNASEVKLLMGSYRDPVTGDTIGATDVQALVSGTDYAAVDGSGADATADISIVMTAGPSGVRFSVTNNAAGVITLTMLKVRGKGIYDNGLTQYTATDATSITTHGEHAITYDMPYQGDPNIGQTVATYFKDIYADPFAYAKQIRVRGTSVAVLTQLLTRDIGDRITVSETVTGVNGDFFIHGIELSVSASGHLEGQYILTPAVDPFGASSYWQLGSAGASEIGTTTYLAF